MSISGHEFHSISNDRLILLPRNYIFLCNLEEGMGVWEGFI